MVVKQPRELAVLDNALRMLERARSLDEIKEVRDKAETARAHAKRAKWGLQFQNLAAEIKLRAERNAGNFLASLKLRGGDRRSKLHHVTVKLEDLGISRQQSRRWQQLASISEKDFAKYIQTANELGREVTSAGLLRMAGAGNQRRTKRWRCDSRSVDGHVHFPASASDTRETYVDAEKHCEVLIEMLRPFYEGGKTKFQRLERRIVCRMLCELRDFIKQLKQEWLNAHPEFRE
jgi:hypothetical protein